MGGRRYCINSLKDIFLTGITLTASQTVILYQFLKGYISNNLPLLLYLCVYMCINSLKDIFLTIVSGQSYGGSTLYQFLKGYISNEP